MRFLIILKGCFSLNGIGNEYIRAKLNDYSVEGRIRKRRRRWIEHIYRMEECRLFIYVRSESQTLEEVRKDVGKDGNILMKSQLTRLPMP